MTTIHGPASSPVWPVTRTQLERWRSLRTLAPPPAAVVDELASLLFLPPPVRVALLVDVAREAADEALHLAGLLGDDVPVEALDQLVDRPGDVTVLVLGGRWVPRARSSRP